MNFRTLSPAYTTSPQIRPTDVPMLKHAGYACVICNRPDGENPPDLQSAAIRKAVEEAGMTFVFNPIIGGAMTPDNVTAQDAAMSAASGPVFAYCASGNRSSIVWALANAGRIPTDQMIRTAAQFGYNLEPARAMIEARARA